MAIKPIECMWSKSHGTAVAVTLVIAAAMLMLWSCERKPVMSHSRFINVPSQGWLRSAALQFQPEYDDSARTYDLTLAVRHDISYPCRNLALVVDIIAADSVKTRKSVNLMLADEYGNWTGGGFGSLYQNTVRIASVIDPGDASRVVVWQAMQGCDTLRGVVNVGLVATPL